MGNSAQPGYHLPPNFFLKKYRKGRKKSATVFDSQQDYTGMRPRRSYTHFVNEPNVTNFLLENPAFLDDFVESQMTLQRVQRWEKSLSKVTSNVAASSDDDEHLERLTVDDAKKLYQIEKLRSLFYYPARAESLQKSHLLEVLERIEEKPPCDIENHLFPFSDIPEDDINSVLMYLFESLLGRHAFARYNLVNFLADVKTNYLPTEYHNYHHALCHVQTMYWILKSHPACFSGVEKKVLMIASLCHDVGHPGYNEDFLLDVFKKLWYNSPALESHHTQACYGILMVGDSNILHDLSNEEFDEALSDIRECILSTFISRYKDQLKLVSKLIEEGFSFDNKQCRDAAKLLLMMVCDLSASWKPWKVHVTATWCLYKEFVNQGEKQLMLGSKNPLMTREKLKNTPTFQVDFLEKLAIPMFEEAAKIFPCLQDAVTSTRVLEGFHRNIEPC